jgi:hypothetical protein
MTLVKIDTNKKDFTLRFKYDRRLIAYIQHLKCGSKWNKKDLEWQLPITRLRTVKKFLTDNSYEIRETAAVTQTFPKEPVPARTRYIHPGDEEQLVYLTKDKSSWIKVVQLKPSIGLDTGEFDHLMQFKPKQKHTRLVNGKPIDRSFYKALFFGNNRSIPTRLEKLMNDLNSARNARFNHASVFWFDETGYVTKSIVDFNSSKSVDKESEICYVSLGPAMRSFIVEPRHVAESFTQYLVASEHNTLIVCGGPEFHATHVCSVPKSFNAGARGERVCVVFKCLKS